MAGGAVPPPSRRRHFLSYPRTPSPPPSLLSLTPLSSQAVIPGPGGGRGGCRCGSAPAATAGFPPPPLAPPDGCLLSDMPCESAPAAGDAAVALSASCWAVW